MALGKEDLEHLVGKTVSIYFKTLDEDGYDETNDVKVTKVTSGALHYYLEEQPTIYNTETEQHDNWGDLVKSTTILPFDRILEVVEYHE